MIALRKALQLILLNLLLASSEVIALANCPHGCHCDDNTLVVQCGEGQLDVLPIALNPSIQRLVIRNNKIKTIDSSIQFYAELTFLDLSANHLMTIPQRTFLYQRKLQELHLNHNKIGQISNKTLIGLSAVTVLNLRGNQISELHQATFAPLLKIEELNLGDNRISFIDPQAFTGLTQLRILYLDDNALVSVPDPVVFQSLPSLAELFLGMNTLHILQSGVFQDLKGLTRLDLKGSSLHNITHDAFKGLEAMRTLDLSDNRLQRVPSLSLSHLVRLEELSLGQNEFEVVPEGAFVGLTQLKRLDISGALRLKRVMNGAFAANANLEYLNLSANKMLAEIQEGALSGLPHLRHVIFKANGLTTLAEGLFPWKDLITLDLSENPISCDCRVMWLRNLLLVRNSSEVPLNEVECEFPERLRGEFLKNLNPLLMGCSHIDPRKQALIGALLAGSAATITALALIIYRCRHRIREYLKGGIWGSSTLGGKEREYQKTFCDEDYMTRLQHHPCSLGIHSSFPNTYTPHHPNGHHYGICPLQINDFSNSIEAANNQKNFQQLHVPTTASIFNEKSQKLCGGANVVDDGGAFIMHLKPAVAQQSKLNHYTKPQFLASTAAVGDSCYSYADIPMINNSANSNDQPKQHLQQQQQLRGAQEDTKFQQQSSQRQLHFATQSECGEIVDPNYIYSNTHYSMPLEHTERLKTPTPPPLPPALPLRNGLNGTSTGRRSLNANHKLCSQQNSSGRTFQ